jgi:hypothetical protein
MNDSNQESGADIDVAELVDICLAENERRMSVYDRRLLRPFAVPALAKLVRRFLRSESKPKTRTEKLAAEAHL